jgi:2-polyprenyl-3-methyl-5-hydroxy-6-metoxy-1,4-benzoquinol methylase
MKAEKTVEPQYEVCREVQESQGFARFGLMSNFVWHDDPKRLLFVLSRYKFAAKMLAGREHVLEIGCADAFGTRVVRQEVKQLTAIDFDPIFVRDALEKMDARWNFDVRVHDMLAGPVPGKFDGAYSLDVLEHIPKENEEQFVANITGSISEHGVVLLGTPSLQSQVYASPASKAGHVNCKGGSELKQLMGRFFHNTFIFSMNDEVIHTGFQPMAHYLFALCCHKR